MVPARASPEALPGKARLPPREDDVNRVDVNDLNAMGRLAEAEGEAAIFRDLRMKILIDPADLAGHTRRRYHPGS